MWWAPLSWSRTELRPRCSPGAKLALVLGAQALACGKTAQAEHDATVGASADPSPSFTSGSRVRARMLDDGGGGLVFREWYDTELTTSCSFRLAADGAIRCLPWQSKAVFGLGGRDIVYTDAQCSRAALALAAGVPVPALSHADPAPGATCSEPGYPVRRVGAAVDHDGSYYFRRSDECVGIAAGLPSGAKAYGLEEEISPQAFLSARRVVSENGGRLRPIELHGDDGSFERAAIWDAARREECSYGVTTGDVCVPEVAYLGESFADAECSVRAAWPRGELPTYSRPPCVELGLGAEQAEADACGHFRRPRLFRLGTLVDTVPAFGSDGEACSPLTEDPYYPVASALPDDTLGVIATVTVGKKAGCGSKGWSEMMVRGLMSPSAYRA